MENSTRMGAMYACPVTASTEDCTRVDIEVSSDPQKNIIDDMWLGVAVASQRTGSGRVMACAHRYTRILRAGNENQRRMVGKCYIRGNDLGLHIDDEWQTYHNEICDTNSDLEKTGMCQMGISSTDYVLDRETWDQKDRSFPDHKRGHSYMGYTTEASTDVLLRQNYTFITGAPRYNHTGAVFLMAANNDSTLQEELMLFGEQVGSYFGSSIALADLNNDGWQDLIIGAPYYFDRKEEKGGAVYVYMNLGGTFHSSANLTLTGPRNSSFGFAVANIGDVDKDDFQDIAIGAPFEGSGKVYIYHSSVGGLIDKPQQIISGKDFVPGITTFGYSFSGGMDQWEEESSAWEQDVEKSIEVKICFSYSQSAGNPKYKETIKLNYIIKADQDRRPPRVYFAKTQSSVFRGQFSMPNKCQTLKVLLRDDVRDKLHPIAFSMSYSLAEKSREFQLSSQSLDEFPVLNEDQPRENHTENVCEHSVKAQQLNQWRNGKQVLQYSRDVKKLHLGVDVTNQPTSPTNGEDAHEALLNITYSPSLQPSSVRPTGACMFGEMVLCEIGNPFKKNQQAELIITFEVIGISLYTQDIIIQVEPSTISFQEDLNPVSATLLVDYTIDASLRILSVDPIVHSACPFLDEILVDDTFLVPGKNYNSLKKT
ncbi:hypothetical protein JD844_001911 [Phrynosoma platyrhinos]|uniref:Integrin alpha first immunoglubulin-like domain-containing protein n=1 Tax=Phrynosoma platyrhinos TaxID=52577 RepID=A0ABQ7TB32_PHRPL|nr:hypothetical protein JD844_001911 [Phrynosoma platyrhinos]